MFHWIEHTGELELEIESPTAEEVFADALVALAEQLRDGEVRARIRGHTGDPPHLVKAVTYHALDFEQADGGWRARVVLDV